MMGIRSTVARSRDGEELIIPNFVLVQSTVKNYTLADAYYRMQVSVGVTYSSDMARVRQTLETTAKIIAQKWGVTKHPPLVVMAGFGDNAVEFKVAIWMSNPWLWLPAINELHEAIWWAFQENEITIAFRNWTSILTTRFGKFGRLAASPPKGFRVTPQSRGAGACAPIASCRGWPGPSARGSSFNPDRHPRRDQRLGPEPLERRSGMHRHDCTNGKPGSRDQRNRPVAAY